MVRWPYSVEIESEVVEQIDGFIHIGRFSCIVESKHTERPVAIAPIAKMRNQLLRRHSGAIGLVFSYAGFTDAAVILAKYIAPQAILLWTGPEIGQARPAYSATFREIPRGARATGKAPVASADRERASHWGSSYRRGGSGLGRGQHKPLHARQVQCADHRNQSDDTDDLDHADASPGARRGIPPSGYPDPNACLNRAICSCIGRIAVGARRFGRASTRSQMITGPGPHNASAAMSRHSPIVRQE